MALDDMTSTEALLRVGSTAVRRDVFRGRVWTEGPVRVLAADRSSVRAALWPGVVTRGTDKFVESSDSRAKALRAAALDDLALGEWGMADWTWRWNSVVTELVSGRWFTVAKMYSEAAAGALACWYVNFERPPAWHASGWDTMDLAVDLVVDPDGAWHWKDEDEYAQCRRLGLITDAEYVAVEEARDQAVALVEARDGLFDGDAAESWLPELDWPLPSLSDVPAFATD